MKPHEISKIGSLESMCRNLSGIYNSGHSISAASLLAVSQDAIETIRDGLKAVEAWQARLKPPEPPAELVSFAMGLMIEGVLADQLDGDEPEPIHMLQETFEALGYEWPNEPTSDEIRDWLETNDYEPGEFEF